MLDDREFVAAEPSHDLAVARQSFQSPRNRHQHHVANSMTMMIVYRFEAIQIENMDGNTSLLLSHDLAERFSQPKPV